MTKELKNRILENKVLTYEERMEIVEALEQQPSKDCVSREQALLSLTGKNLSTKSADELIVLFDKRIKALPPVTPTHESCKDCTKSKILNDFEGHSVVCSRFGRMAVNPDFYCADFEKRGNENE